MSCFTRPAATILFALALVLAGSHAGAAEYPFSDSFEEGLTRWVAEAPWGVTTAYYHSAPKCVTDSPLDHYQNNMDASLALASSLDLSAAVRPAISFQHRYEIEDGFDVGSVEVSTDGGASWSQVLATYTGSQSEWVREQVDLDRFTGDTDVRVRFRLVTDGSVTEDGWYIDDVVIGERPAAVSLDPPDVLSPAAVDLSWSPSGDPGFAEYKVLRSIDSPLDWRTATVVAEILDPGQTTLRDVAVTPKTTYHYVVLVLTTSGVHSLSNEVTASVPPEVAYPFLDDAEGAGSFWLPEGTWSLSDEAAFSGQRCWSDSPGGNYADGIVSQSLTLANPLDFSAASEPVLTFEHEWAFAAGDLGAVEVSTDGGASWTALAIYTAGASDGWQRARLSLGAFAGEPEVLVRFRISTDAAETSDGWHLDDISIAESPPILGPPVVEQVMPYSLSLSWSPSTDQDFSHYVLFRDVSDAVGTSSPIAAIITDRAMTTVTDTGLSHGGEYFYRVYQVNLYGTFSPDSPAACSATTGGARLPFSDGFEGALDAWYTTGDWAATEEDSHSGSRSLTDSPGGPSDDTWSSATTVLDLTGTDWPVLRFWDRLAVDPSFKASIVIRNSGYSVFHRYDVSGTTNWALQSLDLSEWKNGDAVTVVFGVGSRWSSCQTDDGWHLDDVSIVDHHATTLPPFQDGAEAGLDGWFSMRWGLTSEDAHGGSYAFRYPAPGMSLTNSPMPLELATELDLSGTSHPQVAFSARGSFGSSGLKVQVSVNGGFAWHMSTPV